MKNVHKVLVAISVLFANLLLLAETEFANGYTWTYRIVGDGAEIYGYADSDGDWYIAASPEPTGTVTIPVTLGGKPVTNIGGGSFRNCGGLTSVAIPDGVTSIGEEAFRKCKGLTKLTIPNSVTSIVYKAFYGCTSLTSVTIPDSVTSIGDFVFCNCSGLTSMTISDSTTRIGEGAYLGCKGLADKYGFVIVRDVLYSYCGGGGDITIPDSVTKIGNYAFQNCTDLTSVTIPDSVTDIGDGVFAGCSGLADENGFVIVRGVLHCYCGDGGDVIIPDSVTSIGDCAFLGCTRMTSVTIPDSVTRIGKEAFCECSSLTSVTIPGNVMSIEEEAFEGCIGLTSVTIPVSVTRIDKEAFEGCIRLMSVTIPDSVTSIGGHAFYSCVALKSIYVSPGDADRVKGLMLNSGFDVTSANFIEIWMARVVFDANGGSVNEASRSVASGSAVGVLPTPTRNGYSFIGWWNMVSGGAQITASTKVTEENVTYYAHWTKLSDLEPEEAHVLFEEVDGEAPASAASEYNGYLYDEKSGAVKGTIQVKIGKPSKKDGKATVKATVVVGTKKITLKGADMGKAAIASGEPTEIELVGKGAEECSVMLGAYGITGYYGAYIIDGARNIFSSKDKGDLAEAKDALDKCLGSRMVIWDDGSVSVSIAAKGKVKVSGTLASGAKVSATAVLLVGEEWNCVSVAAPKANLSFVLWLSRDGKTTMVDGLGDDVLVGSAGTLADGAAFRVPADAALWSAIPGTVLTGYLPDGVPVTKKGTKWTLPKVGRITMKKGVIDVSKAGENPSGLKLTYKAKDGTFKGSFKVYAVNKGKLKATTVNVTGFLLNGIGFGTAMIKKVGSVSVRIE